MPKPDYSRYSSSDLALDASFRAWCLRESQRDSAFWDAFESDYPRLVQEAKGIVRTVSEAFAAELPDSDQTERAFRNIDRLNRDRLQVRSRWRYWSAAACILVLVALGAYRILGGPGEPDPRLVVHSTDYGEVLRVVLPDSSVATLNGNSTLSYPEAWADESERSVALKGEAYFEVRKHRDGTAFIVRTDHLAVRVLGTVFNVNSYREATEVYLKEGRVNVYAQRDSSTVVALVPGELVRYAAGSPSVLPPAPAPASSHISWIDGVLSFEDQPLSSVLEALADAQGLKVSVRDQALSERRFTLAVPTDDPAAATAIIAKTTKTRVEEQADGSYLLRTPDDVE